MQNVSFLGIPFGILQPETTIYLFEKFKRELDWHTETGYNSENRQTALGIHNHNDFGQATANTVAAVFHGGNICSCLCKWLWRTRQEMLLLKKLL